jgi:hypothetical protein
MSKRTEAEILKDIVRNSCALSPENLSCDGMLKGMALRRKLNRLQNERKALIKELGREPTFDEEWGI